MYLVCILLHVIVRMLTISSDKVLCIIYAPLLCQNLIKIGGCILNNVKIGTKCYPIFSERFSKCHGSMTTDTTWNVSCMSVQSTLNIKNTLLSIYFHVLKY